MLRSCKAFHYQQQLCMWRLTANGACFRHCSRGGKMPTVNSPSFWSCTKKYQKMMSDAKHSFLVSFSRVFRFFTSDLLREKCLLLRSAVCLPPRRRHHVAHLVPPLKCLHCHKSEEHLRALHYTCGWGSMLTTWSGS